MTDDSSHSNRTAPTRAQIETWGMAFADDSDASFGEMAAANVALEGSIFPATINGRGNVYRAMRLCASLYDELEFVHQAVLPDRTYMEWEATALGLQISGITVLTIDSGGWLVGIALHHRPLPVVQRFSAEFGARWPRSSGPDK